MKKNIIFTIDYEIFLGKYSGTVENCMIKPTGILSKLLLKYNCTMTVFWDVLHYWRMLQDEKLNDEFMKDRLKIEEQLIALIRQGHDIQLHLHPSWLGAKYSNGNWLLNNSNYVLHNFDKNIDFNDIETIHGCVSIGKKIIETLYKKAGKEINVFAFRAGGLRLDPFDKIMTALKDNNIYVDSSTAYGIYQTGTKYPFNYSDIPNKTRYRFSESVHKEDETGYFFELPIETINLSPFRNLWYQVLKRYKYKNLGKFGDGKSVDLRNESPKQLRAFMNLLFHKKKYLFTPEGNFKERFEYFVKQARENSTLILHPKNLNNHQLYILENQLAGGNINFMSIRNYLSNDEKQ